MSRVAIIIANDETRRKAMGWIKNAPWNTRLELRESARTPDQNDKMWPMLTEISKQKRDWPGGPYSADDWKDWFMHALKQGRWMPTEEGGMVPIGMGTSKLTKAEMSDLIELMYAFGVRHGVLFADGMQGQEKTDATTLSEPKEPQ